MFRNLIKYEWLRYKALRSSWIWVVAIMLFMALIGYAQVSSGTNYEINVIYGRSINILGVLIGLFSIVFTAIEYRHNTIRGLLVATNKRNKVFGAKLLYLWFLSAVFLVVAMVVIALVASATAAIKGSTLSFSNFSTLWFWRDIGRDLLYCWLFASLGFSLSKIFRDTVVPIVTFLITPLFIENILTGLTKDAHWTSYLPFRASDTMFNTTNKTEFLKYGGAFLAYCLVLLSLAYYWFNKKDITK